MKNDSVYTRILRTFANSPVAGPLVTLLGVSVLFLLIAPNFASWRTVSGIITAVSISGFVTIGITLLMIAGEFDLSIAPMIAMSGYLFGSISTGADTLITRTLLSWGLPISEGHFAFAILFAVAVPALMGLFNGLLLVWTNIPSFIITLGTRQIFRGLVWVVAGAELLQVLDKPVLYEIFNGRFDLLNDFIKATFIDLESKARVNFRTATLWLIGAAIFFQYVLMRTPFGNHLFAAGGNPAAAVAQGVRTARTKLFAFVISGFLAGVAGIIQFSQFRSVRVAEQAGIELTAIAGAVVGGALLTGGYGSVWGALIGVLIISVLRSGVILYKFPLTGEPIIASDNFEAIVGVTIIAAVILNNYLRSRATS